MKRFLITMVLACAFASPALAGDIPSVGAPQPPPGETSSATSAGDIPSVPGDVPSVGFAQQISSAGLSALLAVIGLL